MVVDRSTVLEIKLPKLQVGVYEDGELVRTIELTDPREAFCNSWRRKKREGTVEPLDPVPSLSQR